MPRETDGITTSNAGMRGRTQAIQKAPSGHRSSLWSLCRPRLPAEEPAVRPDPVPALLHVPRVLESSARRDRGHRRGRWQRNLLWVVQCQPLTLTPCSFRTPGLESLACHLHCSGSAGAQQHAWLLPGEPSGGAFQAVLCAHLHSHSSRV